MENTVLSSDDSMENSSWEWYIDQFMLLPEAKAAAAADADADAGNPEYVKPNYSIVDRSCLLKEYLGFKKRRKGREIIQLDDDDSLEDTASSPINFSKVKDLSYLTSPTEKKDDAGSIFQMKANNVQDSRKRVAMDEAADQASNNATEIKSGCNALRKRGLCLVPLSMLIKYLG